FLVPLALHVTVASRPGGPCGPTAPCGPGTPRPSAPCGPAEPCGPTEPCEPASPWGPLSPFGPCGPGGPSLLLGATYRTRLLPRSEEHTSELQSRGHLVCRLLLEKKNFVCSVSSLD